MNGFDQRLARFHLATWIFPPASEVTMRSIVRAAADPEATILSPHGRNHRYDLRRSRAGTGRGGLHGSRALLGFTLDRNRVRFQYRFRNSVSCRAAWGGL
jgi:hypothetical protein